MCSVQLKSRLAVKPRKINNVIHKTTSETIRIENPDVLLNNNNETFDSISGNTPTHKKVQSPTSSFQITGICVTQRHDLGEDSADESHTDDISRITDNETPSFSEDTCSRDAEDCVLHVSNSVMTNDLETSRFPGTRFKVVKIETHQPFRRGRWTCMDYLDSSIAIPNNTPLTSDLNYIYSPVFYTNSTTSQSSLSSELSDSITLKSIDAGLETTQTKVVDVDATEPINILDRDTLMQRIGQSLNLATLSTSKTSVLKLSATLPIISEHTNDSDTPAIHFSSSSNTLSTTNTSKTVSENLQSLVNVVASLANYNLKDVSSDDATNSFVPLSLLDSEILEMTNAFQKLAGSEQISQEDLALLGPRSADNASAVIDTKIEQAMDLVKSHLMYTVREEVRVLKHRISELMNRITQLETENSLLKANANQEANNMLQIHTQLPNILQRDNNSCVYSHNPGAHNK